MLPNSYYTSADRVGRAVSRRTRKGRGRKTPARLPLPKCNDDAVNLDERLEGAGFDGQDTFLELAFDNDDISTASAEER